MMNENEMGYRGSKSVISLNVNLIFKILTIFAFWIFSLLESTDRFCLIQAVAPILIYENADKDKLNILEKNALKQLPALDRSI